MNRKCNKNSSSKFKGVNFDKTTNKWLSRITVNKKTIFLGRYELEIEAAEAYDCAAIRYHKEFKLLNFSKEK